MKLRSFSLLALIAWMVASAAAQSKAVSFNLSTSKTFAPGEQPTFHLYTHNVDALEFRVYRVNDPGEVHGEPSRVCTRLGQGRDSSTITNGLTKRPGWKNSTTGRAGLWRDIRDFFRHQFTHDARQQLRGQQSAVTRHSRIVSEAEFAQIPLLNKSQLVSRWRQQVPATYISDANQLAVPKLGAGLYLLEATDGHYKAYTLVMVTNLVLVTRTSSGNVQSFVVDRVTGKPIGGIKVDAGFGQKLITSAVTGDDGVAMLNVPGDKSSPDNFWVVAGKNNDFAASTPQSYSLMLSTTGKYAGYVFTERPVYRPTHTVHWKAMLREHNGNALALPRAASVLVTISDENEKAVFKQQMPLAASGDLVGNLELPKDASLGYYTIHIGDEPGETISGGFHVEDYRKPEYRVQVSAAQKRVLEGGTMAVTIDSRYFFGEPVANAKVKYRVYHERHYWWGEEEDDDSGAQENSADTGSEDQSSDAGDEETEKTGKLDANGTMVIQVPTQVDSSGTSHPDFDYRVEAGVTDAANREISGRGRFLATYGTVVTPDPGRREHALPRRLVAISVIPIRKPSYVGRALCTPSKFCRRRRFHSSRATATKLKRLRRPDLRGVHHPRPTWRGFFALRRHIIFPCPNSKSSANFNRKAINRPPSPRCRKASSRGNALRQVLLGVTGSGKNFYDGPHRSPESCSGRRWSSVITKHWRLSCTRNSRNCFRRTPSAISSAITITTSPKRTFRSATSTSKKTRAGMTIWTGCGSRPPVIW